MSARIPPSSAMANASISPMTTTIADAAAISVHRTASALAGSASTNARGRPCRKAAAARTSTAGCTVNRLTAAAAPGATTSTAAPMAALTTPTPATPTTIPRVYHLLGAVIVLETEARLWSCNQCATGDCRLLFLLTGVRSPTNGTGREARSPPCYLTGGLDRRVARRTTGRLNGRPVPRLCWCWLGSDRPLRIVSGEAEQDGVRV